MLERNIHNDLQHLSSNSQTRMQGQRNGKAKSQCLLPVYVLFVTAISAVLGYFFLASMIFPDSMRSGLSSAQVYQAAPRENRRYRLKSRLVGGTRKRMPKKSLSRKVRVDSRVPERNEQRLGSNKERIRQRLHRLTGHKGFGDGKARYIHAALSLIGFFAMFASFIGSINQRTLFQAGSLHSHESGFIFFIRNDENDVEDDDGEELDGERANAADREMYFHPIRILD